MPPKKNFIDKNNNESNNNQKDNNVKEEEEEKKINFIDNIQENQTKVLNINKSESTQIDETPTYPYTNVVLTSNVMITPDQMGNKLELNIKKNLKENIEGKIFGENGFITNVYKIEHFSDPIIDAENFTGSAKTIVKFLCEISYPISNKFIICKVQDVVKELIKCINGPIVVLIKPNMINENIFYRDQNRNFRIKQNNIINSSNIDNNNNDNNNDNNDNNDNNNDNNDNEENTYLCKDMFVKVFVTSSRLNFKNNIICVGNLHNLANQNEINKYYKD